MGTVDSLPEGHYGHPIVADTVYPATALPDLMKGNDTLAVALEGLISESCRHSGCWMDVPVNDSEHVHVTFRDDAFSIPLDAAGSKVVFAGTVFKKITPVELLKKEAQSEGLPQSVIDTIQHDRIELQMIADGVVLETR
ncbi:MAG: hypothetical protein Kow00127_22510 [Bacteroidales bacterium]